MATTTPALTTKANGQTIDQTWFNAIKAVLENHEGRLGVLSGELQQFVFRSETLLDHLTLPAMVAIVPIIENILLTDAKVYVFSPGTTGTFEADFQFKRGTNAWQSVLNTKPSLTFDQGAMSTSTNGVINPVYANLAPGDFVACVITQIQGGAGGLGMRSFSANLFHTKAS